MTLTCAELVEQVTAYLDGALEPDAERHFERHLAACSGCAAYLDQSRVTVRLLGTASADGVTGSARAALLATFRHRRGAESAPS